MGVRRLFGGANQRVPAPTGTQDQEEAWKGDEILADLHTGSTPLEVVGESRYQDNLWSLVGGRWRDRVRIEVTAILVPDDDNEYDADAISVWVKGLKVGHLSRENAAKYRPGLLDLQRKTGKPIALRGRIVGGGQRGDGPGMLGIWLNHNPQDFGIVITRPAPAGSTSTGAMRSGLSGAIASDAGEESYDLSWMDDLPDDPVMRIRRLRQLLSDDPDAIDRHYMFCQLEADLYYCRDTFASALDEFDETCVRHDAEMDGIREALFAKFGKVPLLDTYRQMAIRKQKQKDWAAALRWTERGLALYGDDAARTEAVEDLKKRASRYRARLRG